MPFISLALGTDSPVVFSAVGRALEIHRQLQRSCPPIIIEGGMTDCKAVMGIGPIMREAYRRAECIRTGKQAHAGVSIASGPAAVFCDACTRRMHFTAYVIVAVLSRGAIFCKVVPSYPQERKGDVEREAIREYKSIPQGEIDEQHAVIPAVLAADVWAHLKYPADNVTAYEYVR